MIHPLRQGDQAKDILEKYNPPGDEFCALKKEFGVLQDFLLLFNPGLLKRYR